MQPIIGHKRYVFIPAHAHGRAHHERNTLNAALRGISYSKEVHTAHDFRALPKTILDELLGERVALIEHQLVHALKDPNGRGYNRTAPLRARREMRQRPVDYLGELRACPKVFGAHFANCVLARR